MRACLAFHDHLITAKQLYHYLHPIWWAGWTTPFSTFVGLCGGA